MRYHKIEFVFCGYEGFQYVRQCIGDVLHKVLPRHCTLMEVAFHEAANNALKHGCSGLRQGNVRVRIRISGQSLILRVRDQGRGFAGNELLRKLSLGADPFDNMLFQESGRGLLLMKAACDYMVYNRRGNEVLLMKHIDDNNKNQDNWEVS